MAIEKRVNHLSVFLIKQQYSSAQEVIRTTECPSPTEVAISGHNTGQLFIKKTPPVPPRWSALFTSHIDLQALAIPGVAAAFVIEINERLFVLTFGQGGRFLLKEDVAEERFGLICALNSVDPKTLRCVDVQSLDAIDSHTRIQSGQETTSDQFGLSVEQDMLKAIVGAPKDQGLGNRMTGSDALSVSVKMDLSDLPFLLDSYRKNFEKELSAEDHQWVNNISLTKSSTIIANLEANLNAKLLAGKFQGIWLSIPEVIEWETVKGFMYTHGKRVIHPDINFQSFLSTVDGPVSLSLLRDRTVFCADGDHRRTFKSWPVYKCLYADIVHDGALYVLNDGQWFNVAKDFVQRTNKEYSATPLSKLKMPKYAGGGEGAYNKSVAELDPTVFDLLDDKKKIMHGGGHGQVEVCDLLSSNRELIHVKIYSKSSVLSHLFAQGFVSGQLIQIDSEFRKKVKNRLSDSHKPLLDAASKPDPGAFTIVYAIISEEPGEQLHLPFFSRVNLNNTRKLLLGYGFNVELLKIHVGEFYAKTTKSPPNKKTK